jgi:TonB family protein
MRKLLGIVLTTACACCANLESDKVRIAPPVNGFRVERSPSAAEIGHVYPAEALRRGIPGRVVIECTLDAAGGPHDCFLEREDPAGLGFCPAALMLALAFVVRPLDPARSPRGEKIRLPVAFQPR